MVCDAANQSLPSGKNKSHLFSGSFLALSSDCTETKRLCLKDSVCNTTYQTLENCSSAKTHPISLDHDARAKCLDAELAIRSSPLLHCKCRRRMRRQEHCLHIYWTVHSSLMHGYMNMETSPYKDPANKEPKKMDYSRLAALVSDSNLAGDNTNHCLKATHICSMNKKCIRWRTAYASICTRKAETGATCNRHMCHKGLRHFFEKVHEDFTKRLLFCPCENEVCGERRRKAIVPECSFQESIKPNCLSLWHACVQDNICKSRLADFQHNCQPADAFPDGCSQHNHAACLQAYLGMIGTHMTPNYISNSSVAISLWCTCESSGNQKEECDQILGMFISNKCLKNTIQSQMHLNYTTQEGQAELSYTPSQSIQGRSTSISLASGMIQEMKVKTKQDISEHSSLPRASSVYSGAGLSWPCPVLLLLLLSPL
ncbi:PREDICTED: GDNF family receptor alpha-3 isoform X1 [Crocodylus porosus]|uniref:GDNF family receptor alpha-3 isoform X1 n=1 Tax=Crocodylus porosus TaxID=8502 RepID=UPI00093BD076|nr:PREDICTED: GDNF family receptor alpha-3 isoform X1 [Crocodylus porosus]